MADREQGSAAGVSHLGAFPLQLVHLPKSPSCRRLLPKPGPGHCTRRPTAHSQAPYTGPSRRVSGTSKGVTFLCICGDMSRNEHLGERRAAGEKKTTSPKPRPPPSVPPPSCFLEGAKPAQPQSWLCNAVGAVRMRGEAPSPAQGWDGGESLQRLPSAHAPRSPPPRERQTPAVRGGECAGAGRPPPWRGWELS